MFWRLLPLSALVAASLSSQPSEQPQWGLRSPIPLGPQQEESVATLGTDFYIVGGITTVPANRTSIPSLAHMQVYSTTTDTWSRAADIPIPVNHANMATLGGRLYVLGAIAGDGENWPIGNGWVYSPEDDAWADLPAMPAGTERGASAVGVWRDSIIIAGGLNYTNFFNGVQYTIPWVSMYNTRTREWDTDFPDLPGGGRDHCGGVMINDTFYVVGGRVSGEKNVRGSVLTMDLAARDRVWVERTGMPTPRGSHSTALLGGKIYTFGGEGNPVGNGIFDNVEVYDVGSDSWEVLPPMPLPRHGTATSVVGGQIFIPGGANTGGAGATDTNQIFTP